ncbi:FAD-binding oxidoreductase [Oceanotoga sp. DSM 15011]|uniref:iron-sulfur cluster-binding protein n=1 Tax=unclassified Oceanotoga TaxID=2618448 RepID=UPI0021F44F65|nr:MULTISPECIES: FAD-binding oxidoreductase [unclassified Oceanotoga]MDN5342640.1 dihydroorotate dehydrogenase electron transfer subunit [Oceanotoga sp.]UYO99051.1 FAD-binding oxidoreductase [Oceanotoga sp. DSM 15011]
MNLARVVENKSFYNYGVITFKTDKKLDIEPGQFLMMKSKDGYNLSKPFSVMDCKDFEFKVLIRNAGDFSKFLIKLKIGEELLFRGPYGSPFSKFIDFNKKYILIGGGCGSAPLMHFKKIYPNIIEDSVFGFSDYRIKSIVDDDNIFVDRIDGMNPVDYILNRNKGKDINIISCGPKGMFIYLKYIIDSYQTAWISMEENMGCGIGMCKGCPVDTVDGVKMVCKDGPLFNIKEVIL